MDRGSAQLLRTASKAIVETRLDLSVTGQDHIPHSGPAIIAARHYHHLYDGCAILATVPRQVQVLVGLDWAENRPHESLMNLACQMAHWPIVHRASDGRSGDLRRLRRAFTECAAHLQAGRILLIFPEGFPTIDPHGSPKTSPDEFLPFHAGFAHIAREVSARIGTVPVIPAGLWYGPSLKRQRVALRFGNPVLVNPATSISQCVKSVQNQVEQLSA